MFIFLISLVGAYECQDQTSFWNIPCDLATPVILCSGNATIININNTAINTTTSMTPVGAGIYNLTFPYTNISTYIVRLCDNSTATIDVVHGNEESEPQFNLWLILFSVFFVLLIFGFYKGSHIFLFSAGTLSLIMGIWIFNDGISLYTVSDWWVYSLAWIVTGMGLILILVSSLDLIRDMGGEEF